MDRNERTIIRRGAILTAVVVMILMIPQTLPAQIEPTTHQWSFGDPPDFTRSIPSDGRTGAILSLPASAIYHRTALDSDSSGQALPDRIGVVEMRGTFQAILPNIKRDFATKTVTVRIIYRFDNPRTELAQASNPTPNVIETASGLPFIPVGTPDDRFDSPSGSWRSFQASWRSPSCPENEFFLFQVANRIFIDDVRIDTQCVVPEPGSLVVLAVGLLTLRIRSRRVSNWGKGGPDP